MRDYRLKKDQYKLALDKEARLNKETEIRQIRADVAAGVLDLNQGKLEIQRMLAEHKISDDEAKREIDRMKVRIAQQNANTAAKRVNDAAQGSTTVEEFEIDPVTGKPKKKTVSKTPNAQPTNSKPKINY